jgi:hypothetical protein
LNKLDPYSLPAFARSSQKRQAGEPIWRWEGKMAIAFCPDCEEPVHLGQTPKVGQRIVCANCEADLEVIEVSPLELDWAYDEPSEDWSDEEDDWDDEEEEGDDWDDDDWDDDEDEEDEDYG